MTNANIIFNESIRLMDEGILKPTGKTITITDENGNKTEVNEPEVIHTYAIWKSLGRQVKRGQKAVADFYIWKCVSKNTDENEDADIDKTKMFLKRSFFFTIDQTDAIETVETVETVEKTTQETTEAPKYQESVYNKYSKKYNFIQTTEYDYSWFTNSEILFGTKFMNLEGEYNIKPVLNDMILDSKDDSIDVDKLKVDIKALKSLKEKQMILKTENGNMARFNITYIQDALKFLNVKKGFVKVGVFTKGCTTSFTFSNENGYALMLNLKDDDVKTSYNKQNEKIDSYYNTLNK